MANGYRKPRQRLVLGGVDIFDEYGAVMTDDYELGSPEPKTYSVDVPGGNGSIDLTSSLTGDCVYGDRKQTFTLLFPTDDFWNVYRRFKNDVHGRAFDYKILGIDDEGTYHGRFAVDEHYSRMHYGVAKLSVTAEPFRFIRRVREVAHAGGGVEFRLSAGRCPVRPLIYTSGPTAVQAMGRTAELQAGVWSLDYLWASDKPVVVFVDSTYGQYGNVTISSIANTVMKSVESERVSDLSWGSRPTGERYDVYFEYDVKDL